MISTLYFFSKMDTVCKSYRILNFSQTDKKSKSIDDVSNMDDDVNSDVEDEVSSDVADDVSR